MCFRIYTNGCVKGYGIVRDYLGNTWFYGTIEECKEWIDNVEGRITDEVEPMV